jgi:ubiquinone/menaquinone biosynthesis C-methylase UbiE
MTRRTGKGDLIDKIRTTLQNNLLLRATYLKSLYNILNERNDISLEKESYLDIGSGLGINSQIFGEDFNNILNLDIDSNGLINCRDNFERKGVNKAFFIQGDARLLPFKDETFCMVTMISLIEHVKGQIIAIEEANRVLKANGLMIIQIPNRYFLIELHSGIPFLYYLPQSLRRMVLKRKGYVSQIDYDVASIRKIVKMIENVNESFKVEFLPVIYPIKCIPKDFQFIYSALRKFKILNLIPIGWFLVCRKKLGTNLIFQSNLHK